MHARIDDLTPEEDRNEIVYNVKEREAMELRQSQINNNEVVPMPIRQREVPKTATCCCFGPGKAAGEKEAMLLRQQSSIKQARVIS